VTQADDRTEPLAKALGIGLIIHEVETGPPVRILATAMLDGDSTELVGTGPSEDDAWKDLAAAAVRWKNEDGRNIRTFFGGF
jgi:hypothetical protein